MYSPVDAVATRAVARADRARAVTRNILYIYVTVPLSYLSSLTPPEYFELPGRQWLLGVVVTWFFIQDLRYSEFVTLNNKKWKLFRNCDM